MATIYKPTFNPTGYDSSYKAASVTNPTNGQTSSSSTTYAEINLTTGSNAETYMFYTFNTSSIPANAEILSVECTAKAVVSSTSSSYIPSRTLQLYSGTTAKGSATTIVATSSNSTATHTLTCGTWTRDELENCRLRIYAKRGTSSTSSTRYIRFYGATITVKYWIPATFPVLGNISIGSVGKTIKTGYVPIDGVNKKLVRSYANVNGIWVPTFKYETLTETTWKKYTAEQVITSSRYYVIYSPSSYSWYDISYADKVDSNDFTAEQFESINAGRRIYKDYTDLSTSNGISITVFSSDYIMTVGSGSFNELKDYMGKEWYSTLYMIPSGSNTSGVDFIEELTSNYNSGSSLSNYEPDSFYITSSYGSLKADHTYKWVCGDYIEDVTSYDSSEYPSNGRKGDYWYIKQ